MNRIEMYASSTHLKQGLHRVLAVAHALTTPLPPGENTEWWSMLPDDERPSARAHTLSLDQLAGVYARDEIRRCVDAARDLLRLSALDHDAAQRTFRTAIISGRAHRAHMGRDVYGISNKTVWDLICSDFGQAVARRYGLTLGETAVLQAESHPSQRALALLEAITAFDTSPKGPDHDACVRWLVSLLTSMSFSAEVMGESLGRPLIVARRPSRGLEGHVVLYGHYDVTPFGVERKWTHPPRALTATDGRLFARGVADNKGPLACRLAALEGIAKTPAVTWIIQGEEETGSPVAKALLPEVMADLKATLWLDETGYHDHEDGTLRLLGRILGADDASEAPDAHLWSLMRGLQGLATRWGVGARHERRGLNKSVVAGGCPFNHNLPVGARYLAIGVNDSAARIHGLNESLPAWTFPLHAAQLEVIFRWAHDVAESEP